MFMDLYIGTFCEIDAENRVFSRNNHFWSRRKCSIDKIDKISLEPTFTLGEGVKSLRVHALDETEIEMTNAWFSNDTLHRVITDLIKLNPKIEVTDNAKKFLSENFDTASRSEREH
jgi:hypothetical protein